MSKLVRAILNKKIDIAKQLIANGTGLYYQSNKFNMVTPFIASIKENQFELAVLIFKYMLKKTTVNSHAHKYDNDNKSALDYAIININIDNSEIYPDGYIDMLFELSMNSLDAYESDIINPFIFKLIDMNCNINMMLYNYTIYPLQHETALMHAIRASQKYGIMTLADKLIDSGCDINLGTEHKFLPIHLAITLRDYNLVEKLVDKGCNLNIRPFSTDYSCYNRSTPAEMLIYGFHDSFSTKMTTRLLFKMIDFGYDAGKLLIYILYNHCDYKYAFKVIEKIHDLNATIECSYYNTTILDSIVDILNRLNDGFPYQWKRNLLFFKDNNHIFDFFDYLIELYIACYDTSFLDKISDTVYFNRMYEKKTIEKVKRLYKTRIKKIIKQNDNIIGNCFNGNYGDINIISIVISFLY
ncbi:MAG: hypothetical protein Edafosvirus19_8 [Edafosvirus sp.]|uniref:Uncharacterized protein n=1 Tax=Edafosvirus sp. TaxID=2487765 RepID=A0A3G4ZX55_9VIRU|nr:MAG: hypothetical protein Edafosvirus19_8 [Edafosvirus sp.]